MSLNIKDIQGEWYPISLGQFAGNFVHHLHSRNMIIIANLADEKEVKVLYIFESSSALN